MLYLNHLPNKRPGEHVELFLRRHWFAVAKIILMFTLLVAVPVVFLALAWDDASALLARPILGPLLAMVASVYLLSVWLMAFIEYTDYYLDTWVVTNERIFNIEQHGLFHRIASELHLAQVEDVTAEVRGVWRTIFRFGDVHVQTAAERVRFHFKDVDNPEGVKQKILHLVHEDRRRHGLSDQADHSQR